MKTKDGSSVIIHPNGQLTERDSSNKKHLLTVNQAENEHAMDDVDVKHDSPLTSNCQGVGTSMDADIRDDVDLSQSPIMHEGTGDLMLSGADDPRMCRSDIVDESALDTQIDEQSIVREEAVELDGSGTNENLGGIEVLEGDGGEVYVLTNSDVNGEMIQVPYLPTADGMGNVVVYEEEGQQYIIADGGADFVSEEDNIATALTACDTYVQETEVSETVIEDESEPVMSATAINEETVEQGHVVVEKIHQEVPFINPGALAERNQLELKDDENTGNETDDNEEIIHEENGGTVVAEPPTPTQKHINFPELDRRELEALAARAGVAFDPVIGTNAEPTTMPEASPHTAAKAFAAASNDRQVELSDRDIAALASRARDFNTGISLVTKERLREHISDPEKKKRRKSYSASEGECGKKIRKKMPKTKWIDSNTIKEPLKIPIYQPQRHLSAPGAVGDLISSDGQCLSENPGMNQSQDTPLQSPGQFPLPSPGQFPHPSPGQMSIPPAHFSMFGNIPPMSLPSGMSLPPNTSNFGQITPSSSSSQLPVSSLSAAVTSHPMTSAQLSAGLVDDMSKPSTQLLKTAVSSSQLLSPPLTPVVPSTSTSPIQHKHPIMSMMLSLTNQSTQSGTFTSNKDGLVQTPGPTMGQAAWIETIQDRAPPPYPGQSELIGAGATQASSATDSHQQTSQQVLQQPSAQLQAFKQTMQHQFETQQHVLQQQIAQQQAVEVEQVLQQQERVSSLTPSQESPLLHQHLQHDQVSQQSNMHDHVQVAGTNSQANFSASGDATILDALMKMPLSQGFIASNVATANQSTEETVIPSNQKDHSHMLLPTRVSVPMNTTQSQTHTQDAIKKEKVKPITCISQLSNVDVPLNKLPKSVPISPELLAMQPIETQLPHLKDLSDIEARLKIGKLVPSLPRWDSGVVLAIPPPRKPTKKRKKATETNADNLADEYIQNWKPTGKYQCKFCHYSSVTQNFLFRHWVMSHSGLRPYGCAYCNIRSPTKDGITRHQTAKHRSEPRNVHIDSDQEQQLIEKFHQVFEGLKPILQDLEAKSEMEMYDSTASLEGLPEHGLLQTGSTYMCMTAADSGETTISASEQEDRVLEQVAAQCLASMNTVPSINDTEQHLSSTSGQARVSEYLSANSSSVQTSFVSSAITDNDPHILAMMQNSQTDTSVDVANMLQFAYPSTDSLTVSQQPTSNQEISTAIQPLPEISTLQQGDGTKKQSKTSIMKAPEAGGGYLPSNTAATGLLQTGIVAATQSGVPCSTLPTSSPNPAIGSLSSVSYGQIPPPPNFAPNQLHQQGGLLSAPSQMDKRKPRRKRKAKESSNGPLEKKSDVEAPNSQLRRSEVDARLLAEFATRDMSKLGLTLEDQQRLAAEFAAYSATQESPVKDSRPNYEHEQQLFARLFASQANQQLAFPPSSSPKSMSHSPGTQDADQRLAAHSLALMQAGSVGLPPMQTMTVPMDLSHHSKMNHTSTMRTNTNAAISPAQTRSAGSEAMRMMQQPNSGLRQFSDIVSNMIDQAIRKDITSTSEVTKPLGAQALTARAVNTQATNLVTSYKAFNSVQGLVETKLSAGLNTLDESYAAQQNTTFATPEKPGKTTYLHPSVLAPPACKQDSTQVDGQQAILNVPVVSNPKKNAQPTTAEHQETYRGGKTGSHSLNKTVPISTHSMNSTQELTIANDTLITQTSNSLVHQTPPISQCRSLNLDSGSEKKTISENKTNLSVDKVEETASGISQVNSSPVTWNSTDNVPDSGQMSSNMLHSASSCLVPSHAALVSSITLAPGDQIKTNSDVLFIDKGETRTSDTKFSIKQAFHEPGPCMTEQKICKAQSSSINQVESDTTSSLATTSPSSFATRDLKLLQTSEVYGTECRSDPETMKQNDHGDQVSSGCHLDTTGSVILPNVSKSSVIQPNDDLHESKTMLQIGKTDDGVSLDSIGDESRLDTIDAEPSNNNSQELLSKKEIHKPQNRATCKTIQS